MFGRCATQIVLDFAQTPRYLGAAMINELAATDTAPKYNPFPVMPQAAAADHEREREIDQLMAAQQITVLMKASAGLLAGLGASLVFCAVQILGMLRLIGTYRPIPYLMLALGVLCVVLGIKVYRARPWATIAGTVLAGITALGMGLWFLLAAGSGFISPVALLSPFVAITATVFSALSIGPCDRARRARHRLAELGMPMDF
jgi:hypothetical protein